MTTSIECFGGTTIGIATDHIRLVIDPLLVHGSGSSRRWALPQWLGPGNGHYDVVIISRAHDVHLHPPTLLGLDPEISVFAYGEASVELMRGLGFGRVTLLRESVPVVVHEGIEVTPIPAEGTQQCALLIETVDARVLDAIDIQDSVRTREMLARHRGAIDAAFLPSGAGASLFEQDVHDSMDSVAAVGFAEWLDARLSCPCEGTFEHDSYDRSRWYAAASRRLSPGRLCMLHTPFELVFEGHERCSTRVAHPERHVGQRAHRECQALVATYLCGYAPTTPARPTLCGPTDVIDYLVAWRVHVATLEAAQDQLEGLLRRTANAFARDVLHWWAPATRRWLDAGSRHALMAEILACAPSVGGADPDEFEGGFFALTEALLRRELRGDQRRHALVCLDFDQRVLALEHEHEQLQLRAMGMPSTTECVERSAERHVEALWSDMCYRRPRLAPNSVWVSRSEIELLTGRAPVEGFHAMLCVASQRRVERLMLDDLQTLVIEHCDGRTLPEIAKAVQRALGTEIPGAERAVFDVLISLGRVSNQLLDWGLS